MESKHLLPLTQAVILALATGGAHAASITVNTAGDSGGAGTCTLRQAIESANTDSAQGNCAAGGGADTITFAANVTGVALTGGELLINSSVTLSGGGQTITAAPYSRVMSIVNNANTVSTVSLSDLTLTGGNYGPPGAGLSIGAASGPPPRPAHGTSANAPRPAANGPMVSLNRVTVSNNTSNVHAGGIFIEGSTVAINQSTISGNSLVASGNYAGGGVYITDGSNVTITDSTISGNSASGPNKYLAGGIYAWNSQLTVINSTITGNRAYGIDYLAGGASVSYGTAGIYNSTISGNTTSTSSNVTAGGLLIGAENTTSLAVSNTILSGNTGSQADMGVFNGSNVISEFNLMGTALSGSFTGNGNVFSDAPGLGALANNGGPTLTMKPNTGSLALGAGSIALIPAGVTTDQRGTGFARVVNGSLDVGAVEAAAGAGVVAATSVPTPTLSTWALGLLGGLLALFGLRKRKRADG